MFIILFYCACDLFSQVHWALVLLLLELVPTVYSQSDRTVEQIRDFGCSDSAVLTFIITSTLAP